MFPVKSSSLETLIIFSEDSEFVKRWGFSVQSSYICCRLSCKLNCFVAYNCIAAKYWKPTYFHTYKCSHFPLSIILVQLIFVSALLLCIIGKMENFIFTAILYFHDNKLQVKIDRLTVCRWCKKGLGHC